MSFGTIKQADPLKNRYTVSTPWSGKWYKAQGITVDELEIGETVEIIDVNNMPPDDALNFGGRLRVLRNYDVSLKHRWFTPQEVMGSFESPANLAVAYLYANQHLKRWQAEYPMYRKGVVKAKHGHGYSQLLVEVFYPGYGAVLTCDCEYMKCDGFPFQVDDVVVVKYDKSRTKPKVVGFWDSPKTCWFENWKDAEDTLCATNHWALSFIGIFGTEEDMEGNDGWSEEDYPSGNPDLYYLQWWWADCHDEGHPSAQDWPTYSAINQSTLRGKFIQSYPSDYDTDPYLDNFYGGFIYTFKGIENYPVTNGYLIPAYQDEGNLFDGNANCQIVIDGFKTWYEGMYATDVDHIYHFGAVSVVIVDDEFNTATFIFLINGATVGNVAATEHLVYDGVGGCKYCHSGARMVSTFREVGLNGTVNEIRVATESTYQHRRVPCFTFDKIGFFPPDAWPITYTDPR